MTPATALPYLVLLLVCSAAWAVNIAANFLTGAFGVCVCVGGGLTLNQSRKETVARHGELQLQKRVVVCVWGGGGGCCRYQPELIRTVCVCVCVCACVCVCVCVCSGQRVLNASVVGQG